MHKHRPSDFVLQSDITQFWSSDHIQLLTDTDTWTRTWWVPSVASFLVCREHPVSSRVPARGRASRSNGDVFCTDRVGQLLLQGRGPISPPQSILIYGHPAFPFGDMFYIFVWKANAKPKLLPRSGLAEQRATSISGAYKSTSETVASYRRRRVINVSGVGIRYRIIIMIHAGWMITSAAHRGFELSPGWGLTYPRRPSPEHYCSDCQHDFGNCFF